MPKFADAIEIDPSAISGVSGGTRITELVHDATVGGIANVKELESVDTRGSIVNENCGPGIEYQAVVDGGPGHANHYVQLSESQYDADMNQVHQNNNVAFDSGSGPNDPGNPPPPSAPEELKEVEDVFVGGEVSADGFSNIRAVSETNSGVVSYNSPTNRYFATVDDGQGNLSQVSINDAQFQDFVNQANEEDGGTGVAEVLIYS